MRTRYGRFGVVGLGILASLAIALPAIAVEAPSLMRRMPRTRVHRFPRLNRSRHWRPAQSYVHARRISPFPDRPVR